MAGKLREVEKNVQETHIVAQSRIKAITLASGSRIGRSQPDWKGETEPHTPGTKFQIYDLFLCSHKNKSPLGNLWHIDQLLSLIHISEPTRRTPISYAVFCLKKKKKKNNKKYRIK